jgi:spermidine/putrescine transport system permease protein
MKRAVKSAYLGIVTLFLYLPLAVLIIYSFNDAKHVVTWKGFTTRWYAKLAENTVLLDAAVNSLLLAAASATAAAIIGTLAAIALKRYRFKGRAILFASMYVVMMSPDIVMGISLLMLFVLMGLPLGFATLFLAHVTFCLPFVTVTVLARLTGLDANLVEAAMDLGAREYEIFSRIILPLAMPGVLAGWLLSFTLSLDDVIISFFVTGPTFEILPLKIYSMVRLGVKPEVNALCAVMFCVTLAVVFVTHFCLKERK